MPSSNVELEVLTLNERGHNLGGLSSNEDHDISESKLQTKIVQLCEFKECSRASPPTRPNKGDQVIRNVRLPEREVKDRNHKNLLITDL